MDVVLAGDIGGTKTHLALFAKESERTWIVDAKFPSTEYPSLNEIVQVFLADHPGYQVSAAAFGIAGPIEEKRKCHATNLPWLINADELEKALGIGAVFLLNDLEANAYGISCLGKDELLVLNEGKEKKGNRALISAGTGLGEAGLFWDGQTHIPFGSEGGHASFSPETEEDVKLLQFLKKRWSHVSFERLLSGPGLYNIYQFIAETGIAKESPQTHQMFATRPPPQVISERGLSKACEACVATLDRFVKIYGNEAGNLALKMLALGGVFLGGGIAPKIAPLLQEKGFMERFTSKGRFGPLLSEIPVKVILNEHTALLGAAYYVRKQK